MVVHREGSYRGAVGAQHVDPRAPGSTTLSPSCAGAPLPPSRRGRPQRRRELVDRWSTCWTLPHFAAHGREPASRRPASSPLCHGEVSSPARTPSFATRNAIALVHPACDDVPDTQPHHHRQRHRREITVPRTPGPRCAPITGAELGDLRIADAGQRGCATAPASAVARSSAAEVVDGEVDRSAHRPRATVSSTSRASALADVRTFSSGDDLPLDHLQQRLDRQRRPEQRRRRTDAAATAQVLERVDVEQRAGARRPPRSPRPAPRPPIRPPAARSAAASTAKPSPIAVERESTTRTTPCGKSCAASTADSQVPDSAADRCTDTTLRRAGVQQRAGTWRRTRPASAATCDTCTFVPQGRARRRPGSRPRRPTAVRDAQRDPQRHDRDRPSSAASRPPAGRRSSR